MEMCFAGVKAPVPGSSLSVMGEQQGCMIGILLGAVGLLIFETADELLRPGTLLCQFWTHLPLQALVVPVQMTVENPSCETGYCNLPYLN
jgi:hypothetical protein